MFEKSPSIRQGDFICDSCRIILQKTPTVEIPYDESVANSPNDETYRSSDTVFEALNKFLSKIDEPPIIKTELRSQAYCSSKLSKIDELLRTHVFNTVPSTKNDDVKIIEQLKSKFGSSADRKEKVTILTLVPESWPTSRILKEFEGWFYTSNLSNLTRDNIDHFNMRSKYNLKNLVDLVLHGLNEKI